jgi:acyl carrier protein
MMFTEEEILEKVIEFIAPLAPQGTPIYPNTDLIQDLGIESIKVMDMLMNLEDEYHILININILMDVSTPAQLARAILKQMEHVDGTV